MLHNVVRGLCRNPGGAVLVASAIGVLAGLKHLMSGKLEAPGRHFKPQPIHSSFRDLRDRFTVRRTESELGYTYWVLQGHGKYRGFSLFDTWQEAIDEIDRRTSREHAHRLFLPNLVAL